MPQPKEYRHIAAWGKLLGSRQYYIADEQRRAANDNAPIDAVYFNTEAGTWVTVDQCAEGTRLRLQQIML